MHSLHGDIHEIGLQDNCPACAEHAEKPWSSLDREMLYMLIERNYYYRYSGDQSRGNPRSDAEALAMTQITNVMERMGALMKVDENCYIIDYLEEKWHIDFRR